MSTEHPTILIVGLGNRGQHYARTRHNIGFLVLDALAAAHNLTWQEDRKRHALLAHYELADRTIMLAKPQTMMNNSGQAVAPLSIMHQVAAHDLWIVYDELDLRLGDLKISLGSSSNGHNGTLSIEKELGHNKFTRFRIGVDTRQGREIPGIEYVLQPIETSESEAFDRAITRATAALQLAAQSSVERAMGAYNGTRANPVS